MRNVGLSGQVYACDCDAARYWPSLASSCGLLRITVAGKQR